MKIITLTQSEFESSCRELAAKAAADGFCPDVVVGIATGGDFVADGICRSLHPAPARFSVSLHRPSTKAKKGLVTSLLRLLPRPVCDLLRIAESRILSFTDRFRKPELPDTAIPVRLNELAAKEHPNILVADDAVDSGCTLLAVAGKLQTMFPEACIRTATITVTRTKPLIIPDYTLFPVPTIVRFPWAADA